MKKPLAVLLTLILLLSLTASLTFAADASSLPVTLTPPEHVSLTWLDGNDSPTTCVFAYSIPTTLSLFQKSIDDAEDKDAFFAQYGLNDAWFLIQIDWALDDVSDSVSGWHYNKYWDGGADCDLGRDSGYMYHYSDWDCVDYSIGNMTETINDAWILRGVSIGSLNGDPENGTIGIKDQLKPEQYTYNYEDEALSIDFTKHTMYVRARFVLVLRDREDQDSYYFSAWSETASYGKDAAKYEGITAKDLPAPEISNLHMTDKEFNDNPIVAYTLSVPDSLAKMAVEASAHGGGIFIETEARVKGDTDWTGMGNADWLITPGEMDCALVSLISENHPSIAKDTPIELRCRYRCSQSGYDDVLSEYSKVLTFETTEIGNDPQPTPPAATETPTPTPTVEEKKDDRCPICHFCPQPLGLCIFIWLLIIIVIVVVIIVVIKVTKKDKDKEKQ
ncbi:MAG: hypothetical protein J5648_08165 [Lachnospiraceae bacterium]|nr:hypothetical protein [Lachnospiraceae bacterium]